MIKDIDLKLLEIFCCVYEKKSLSEATKCLHTSQSTLSFHIKNLEAQIGQKLFYRKGKSLVPTSIADKLYPYARELMEFKLKLLEDIGKYSGKRGGVLRIGSCSVPGNYVLPDLLGEFIARYEGNLSIELLIKSSREIYELLLAGKLDLGIVGFLPAGNGIEARKFYEDRIWPVGSPELEDRIYSLNELKDMPVVMREEGSSLREVVERTLERCGLFIQDMNVVAILGSNDAIKGYLRHVSAISFLPDSALKEGKFLVKMRISGLVPMLRTFYLIRDSSRPTPEALGELMEFLLPKSKTAFDF